MGLPAILTHYEQSAGIARLKRIVVDREGMAAEFLAALVGDGRTVVTMLRTDHYAGLESFRDWLLHKTISGEGLSRCRDRGVKASAMASLLLQQPGVCPRVRNTAENSVRGSRAIDDLA
jgi:hypothetical protein